MSDAGRRRLDEIERMLRLLAVLEAAGAVGVRQDRLLRLADSAAGQDDPRQLLAHDIGELNRAGWEIIAIGSGPGLRYVLTTCGSRVPVHLDRAQEAALLRASRSAAGAVGVADEDLPVENLAECVRAVGAHAVLSFSYRGRQRQVHPRAVQPGPAGWYLVGRDDGGHVDKYFAVARMREVAVGTPASAEVSRDARRAAHDPLSWLVDPPEEVRVRTAAAFAGEVEQALGTAMRRDYAGDDVVLTIAVTHQAAFRRRLYGFGGRVEVLAPERVRAGILAELSQLAGTL